MMLSVLVSIVSVLLASQFQSSGSLVIDLSNCDDTLSEVRYCVDTFSQPERGCEVGEREGNNIT